MNNPVAALSIVKLFMNADPIVKGRAALAARGFGVELGGDHRQTMAARSGERSAREHEARAAAARSAQELSATEVAPRPEPLRVSSYPQHSLPQRTEALLRVDSRTGRGVGFIAQAHFFSG